MAREMKDSGIEWIGEIPINWAVTNIGRLFEVKAGGDAKVDLYSDEKDEEHPYPVYTNTTIPNQVYAYTSLPVFDENTITVTGRGEVGRAFFRKEKYDAIIRLLVLKPKLRLDSRYYTYWIDSVIVFFTNSAAIGQLSAQQILPYKVCFLPYREQQKIADSLDKKCAEVGNVIEKTRASIEQYKKLKQAVITRAVTKGIRDNREMKDSGIEWIGEIPEDWEVNTAFQMFTQVKNKNIDLREKNLLSLSYGKIKQKSMDTVKGLLPESFEGYNIVEKEDIVLRLTDLQNDHKSLRVGFVTERGIVTSAYCTIRVKGVNNGKYLYYYLHSFDIAKGFYGMGAGVRQGLNWDGLKKLKIIVPSLEEQQEIVTYLDQKCSAIDDLIAKKEKYLSEIENYKKSLIYEYVTGKKEVPQKYQT